MKVLLLSVWLYIGAVDVCPGMGVFACFPFIIPFDQAFEPLGMMKLEPNLRKGALQKMMIKKTDHKQQRRFALLMALLLLLTPIAGSNASQTPLETRPQQAGYAPLEKKQTRAPAMHTVSQYDVSILTQELDSPWGITSLPDGRLLITQKDGNLRVVDRDGMVSSPIPGISSVWNEGQGGLLDISLAPDFEQSRLIYVTLALREEGGSLTALGRGRLTEDESGVSDFEILYRAAPAFSGSGHYGSRLVFDQEGMIFLSTGDRQSEKTRDLAQSLTSSYGKVLRLTNEGLPAPHGPFSGQAQALPEIWTLGHRNVQGLAIHPKTGELWASEMGPLGGDELNLLLPGHNYGWPLISYGREYSGQPVGQGLTQQKGMDQPIYFWDPVLAASGMAFYAQDEIPEWEDSLFVCGLGDQRISRLKLKGHEVIGEEWLLSGEGQRFRDIHAHPDGALYAITDGGLLYRIGPPNLD